MSKDQKYIITKSQVNAVNILLKVVEEAIQRKAFNDDEIKNIVKLSNQLSKNCNI